MAPAKKAVTALKKAVSKKPKKTVPVIYDPYTSLSFSEVEKRAHALADHIEERFEPLAHILLEYESYEVVTDEIARTLDILRSLKENKAYFKLRVGAVATFLPRNQPLYAFTCFVIVPSLMASEVHFRIPQSMRHFFPKLLAMLDVYRDFTNIKVSHSTRTDFLLERSALRINPKTKETLPVTDAVIFTGTPVHAEQLRRVFDQRTLFITNGSGHNPLVIGKDAILEDAVEAVLALQLYNQGQDCAAPNTILVHRDVFPEVLRMLRNGLRAVGVGDYRNRECRVGPISDPKDLVRIQDFLIDNREYLDPTTPGIIRAQDATLEPTIICKPLSKGGNFEEIFAPVVFLQEYEKDEDLAVYFEDPRYAVNAMYVTVYGTSSYVNTLAERDIHGKVLHNSASIFHNAHLHAYGSERGTQPYGGNGYGASNLSINREVICKPTLPQRDIFEHIAAPLLKRKTYEKRRKNLVSFSEIVEKDVQKLLRQKPSIQDRESVSLGSGTTYIDLQQLKETSNRYAKLENEGVYQLLEYPNTEYMATLSVREIEWIRGLHALLQEPFHPDTEEFSTAVYAIPTAPDAPKQQKRAAQQAFFLHVYKLLLGKETGPRLAQFLLEVDKGKIFELLDV